MSRVVVPEGETRDAIDELERSIQDMLYAIGTGDAPEQIQARVYLFTSIADLLTCLKSLWSAGESNAGINRCLAELQAEVAACIEELKRGRPN